MKYIVTTLSVILLTSCVLRRSCELAHSHENADRVKEAMREIVIPKVDLRKTPINDAMDFLFQASITHDPKRRGISCVFIATPTQGTVVEGDDPFGESDVSTGPFVTVTGESITWLDLLERICRQADLVWQITTNKVVITPRKE